MTIQPNSKYADFYTVYAREAREADRGLWALPLEVTTAAPSSSARLGGRLVRRISALEQVPHAGLPVGQEDRPAQSRGVQDPGRRRRARATSRARCASRRPDAPRLSSDLTSGVASSRYDLLTRTKAAGDGARAASSSSGQHSHECRRSSIAARCDTAVARPCANRDFLFPSTFRREAMSRGDKPSGPVCTLKPMHQRGEFKR